MSKSWSVLYCVWSVNSLYLCCKLAAMFYTTAEHIVCMHILCVNVIFCVSFVIDVLRLHVTFDLFQMSFKLDLGQFLIEMPLKACFLVFHGWIFDLQKPFKS